MDWGRRLHSMLAPAEERRRLPTDVLCSSAPPLKISIAPYASPSAPSAP